MLKNILVQSLALYAQPEVGTTCQENEQFPNVTNDWLRMGCISKDENVKSFNTQLLKQQTMFHNLKNMTSLPRSIKKLTEIYVGHIPYLWAYIYLFTWYVWINILFSFPWLDITSTMLNLLFNFLL